MNAKKYFSVVLLFNLGFALTASAQSVGKPQEMTLEHCQSAPTQPGAAPITLKKVECKIEAPIPPGIPCNPAVDRCFDRFLSCTAFYDVYNPYGHVWVPGSDRVVSYDLTQYEEMSFVTSVTTDFDGRTISIGGYGDCHL